MSEPMPTIPTQSPFTYPNPNPFASPSFTQDDTLESFIPEPTQPMPTFTQTAFSQPAFSQPNQSIFSQPAVHFQQTQPTQTNQTGQQYPNNQGNSPKRLGKDAKGNTIVHPPVSLDEHVAVQRENKVRTLLLQALPEDHMPDFHHYDDARDIWMAVKARFGGNEESKKMRKTMLKQQFTEFSVTEDERPHKGLWQVSKILRQLNLLLCSTHSAFIRAASSGSKLIYSDQQSIIPSVSQTSGRSDNIMECVLHSFVAKNEPDQDMIYEDFDQVDQLEMEELDLKWQMAMLSLRINSDKSSDSETYASCDSSLKTKTKDFSPAVDIKTLPEYDVEDPNFTAGSPSFSCLENVKSPRIFCNKSGMNNRNVCKNNSVRVKKCFVCGSKLHLIKDCDFYNCVDSVPAGSRNSSASVTAGGSDPAASRNRPAVNSAGRPNPTGRVGQAAHLANAQSNHAGWSKRPAPVSAGRPVSVGWLNPAARPYFRPSSVQFNNVYWPNLFNPLNKGRRGTAVKTSAAKASSDESTRWHRRMAHVNFKTINKLAKEGLVDG
ncbi:ribonuclease H-like domain-containing protein, partial [Tanacetum coccineum]